MKSIILTILTSILWVISVKAEEGYTKNLSTYQGVWIYRSSSEEFRITLKSGRIDLIYSAACLVGSYSYKKNNSILDYSRFISERINFVTIKETGIVATNASPSLSSVNEKELRMIFNDFYLKKSTSNGVITYLDSQRIRWQLFEDEGDYFEDMPPAGFSVPTDIILTKVQ